LLFGDVQNVDGLVFGDHKQTTLILGKMCVNNILGKDKFTSLLSGL
jgi:hypothetical protein